MQDFKYFKPFIIATLIIGFFSILFIYFYYTNYQTMKEKEAAQEVVNETKVIEEPIIEEETEETQKVSVFEKDMETKTKYNNEKVLKNKGKEALSADIVSDFKYDIFMNLYSGKSSKAIDIGKDISKSYDFLDEKYRDFEIFIYELINYFDGFENMKVSKKNNVISKLDSPELILFVFNSLSFNEKLIVSRDVYSEIFSDEINSYLGLTVLSSGTEGIETCGAKNVFFVTSGYDGYYIKFSYLGCDYKLYYLKDEASNQTIIMGIDKLNDEITTIDEYQQVYGD